MTKESNGVSTATALFGSYLSFLCICVNYFDLSFTFSLQDKEFEELDHEL